MNCDEARALLPAYVDGELGLVHSLEIEEHLEGCLSCARIVENQRTLRTAIQAAPLHYAAPPHLSERIDTALRGAARVPEARRRQRWPWFAIAAAVLLGAVLIGRLPFASRPPAENLVAGEILDSHLRSLLPGHLTDVRSSDRHTVKPWFNGRVDFAPPVDDFASQGFPLLGGRLDSVSGRTVAVLIYQRSQHLISLYLWTSPGGADSSTVATSRQGYNLLHWTQGGLTYWLASDVNPGELDALAALLHAGAH